MTTTIKVKKIGNKQFYVTGINKKRAELIIQANTEGKLKELKIPALGIEIGNITKFGLKITGRSRGLSTYVEHLKGYAPTIRIERKIQYRDYTRKEEVQLKNAHLVSTCEDAASSVRSLIRAIPEEYIALWYKED